MTDFDLFLDVGSEHLTEEAVGWAQYHGAHSPESGYVFIHVMEESEYEERGVPACWRDVYAEARRRRIGWCRVDEGGGSRVRGVPVIEVEGHDDDGGDAILGIITAEVAAFHKNHPAAPDGGAVHLTEARLLRWREADGRGEVATPPSVREVLLRRLRIAAEMAVLEGEDQGARKALMAAPAIADPDARAAAQREVEAWLARIRRVVDDPRAWEAAGGDA